MGGIMTKRDHARSNRSSPTTASMIPTRGSGRGHSGAYSPPAASGVVVQGNKERKLVSKPLQDTNARNSPVMASTVAWSDEQTKIPSMQLQGRAKSGDSDLEMWTSPSVRDMYYGNGVDSKTNRITVEKKTEDGDESEDYIFPNANTPMKRSVNSSNNDTISYSKGTERSPTNEPHSPGGITLSVSTGSPDRESTPTQKLEKKASGDLLIPKIRREIMTDIIDHDNKLIETLERDFSGLGSGPRVQSIENFMTSTIIPAMLTPRGGFGLDGGSSHASFDDSLDAPTNIVQEYMTSSRISIMNALGILTEKEKRSYIAIFCGFGFTSFTTTLMKYLDIPLPKARGASKDESTSTNRKKAVVFMDSAEPQFVSQGFSRSDFEVIRVSTGEDGFIDTHSLREGLEQHKERVGRFVCIPLYSCVTGERYNIAHIRQICHTHGAYLCVHSIGMGFNFDFDTYHDADSKTDHNSNKDSNSDQKYNTDAAIDVDVNVGVNVDASREREKSKTERRKRTDGSTKADVYMLSTSSLIGGVGSSNVIVVHTKLIGHLQSGHSSAIVSSNGDIAHLLEADTISPDACIRTGLSVVYRQSPWATTGRALAMTWTPLHRADSDSKATTKTATISKVSAGADTEADSVCLQRKDVLWTRYVAQEVQRIRDALQRMTETLSVLPIATEWGDGGYACGDSVCFVMQFKGGTIGVDAEVVPGELLACALHYEHGIAVRVRKAVSVDGIGLHLRGGWAQIYVRPITPPDAVDRLLAAIAAIAVDPDRLRTHYRRDPRRGWIPVNA